MVHAKILIKSGRIFGIRRYMAPFFICSIVGIALIVLTAKGFSSKKVMTYIAGILFIITGVVALLFDRDILLSKTQITIGLFVFAYSIAGIILVGILINMSSLFRANTKVTGVFVGKSTARSGLFPFYKLSFSYVYNNRRYTQTTTEIVGLLAAARLKEGNEYHIYISSSNPSNMVYRRFPSSGTWWMIIFFVALILIPIGYANGIYG